MTRACAHTRPTHHTHYTWLRASDDRSRRSKRPGTPTDPHLSRCIVRLASLANSAAAEWAEWRLNAIRPLASGLACRYSTIDAAMVSRGAQRKRDLNSDRELPTGCRTRRPLVREVGPALGVDVNTSVRESRQCRHMSSVCWRMVNWSDIHGHRRHAAQVKRCVGIALAKYSTLSACRLSCRSQHTEMEELQQ